MAARWEVSEDQEYNREYQIIQGLNRIGDQIVGIRNVTTSDSCQYRIVHFNIQSCEILPWFYLFIWLFHLCVCVCVVELPFLTIDNEVHPRDMGNIDQCLTHWGRVTHICVSELTIIGSDNGLSPGRRQAIIWTNAGILLIEPLGTNFSEILIEIQIFSFKKMRLKMSSVKWRPFCLGLNVLTTSPKSLYMMMLKMKDKTSTENICGPFY